MTEFLFIDLLEDEPGSLGPEAGPVLLPMPAEPPPLLLLFSSSFSVVVLIPEGDSSKFEASSEFSFEFSSSSKLRSSNC
jgi:hypothetical protein